jgi:Ca-activated chloride channel family protein
MKTSRWLVRSVAVALAMAASSLLPLPRALADEASPGSGTLDARDRDGKPIGACPLEHTDVGVEVSAFVARVVVTQRFRNPFPDPVEATYTFPLSDRGAVHDFELRTGERVIRGDIKRREDARRIYEAARDAGQTAALLEQERPNVFTQSVANLMPGAPIEVRIEYVETLSFRDGAFELVVPTVVGPRFVPGAPTGASGTGWSPDTTRVPDASRITPPVAPKGTRAGHDLSVTVDLYAGVPILDLGAPLHEVEVARPAGGRARVRLARRDEIPNRDFVLRWTVAADAVQSGVLAHRTGDGQGYATFVLVPPRRVTAESAAPKELIFLIDRSGSQSGLPLAKAKETMLWILDHMNPHDTFQVVDFGSTANVLFERPQPASPGMRAKARAHIQALEADGGTMMAEAVRTVCAMPADGNRLRVVTFMTDGFIGNDFEVIDLVRSLRGRSRWFAFGTGNSVNRFLLDGIAKAGGGEADYVLLNDPGEVVARRFWERIASPVLTDVRLEFHGLDVEDVYPTAPSDVWDQRPLIVHARYRRGAQGEVILRGFREGRPYEQTLRVTLPEAAAEHAAIASMWARARVDELMWRDLAGLQSGNVDAAVREQIVTVALAHRLVTQFTSFVAVEERVVNEGGRQVRVTVPVEMPEGVSHEGVFGADAAQEARMSAAPASRAKSAGGPGLLGRLMGKMAAAPPRVMYAPVPRQEADTARADREISDRARRRLAAELLALLEGVDGSAVPVVDGRVTVKVFLRATKASAIRRLEYTGLEVKVSGDGWVIGSVALGDLVTLAEDRGVERVVLP